MTLETLIEGWRTRIAVGNRAAVYQCLMAAFGAAMNMRRARGDE